MENQAIKGTENFSYSYSMCDKGPWSVSCSDKTFQLNNNGIKLTARYNEGLKKVIFDVDKKTIEAIVDNPVWAAHTPRKTDISDSPEFFNDLRDNIETILLTGTYTSVKANEDRTIFEVE